MRRAISVLVLAAAALTLFQTNSSLACAGNKTLLADDFAGADASWGAQSNNFTIKDGAAFIRADQQRGYKALDNAFLFDDADICVTVTAVDIAKPEQSAGGLVFWAQGYRDAFMLLLATNGYYKIGRLMDAAWVNPPLDWTQSDALAQGTGKANKLRLTIKGQSPTIEINDKPSATLRGQAPGAPTLIGLYAESADKVDTWKFSGLRVTNVK
jgi:hypothetical protein